MLEAVRGTTSEGAYLREEYAVGTDELLGNPDPHFMQIKSVIKTTIKGNNSKMSYFRSIGVVQKSGCCLGLSYLICVSESHSLYFRVTVTKWAEEFIIVYSSDQGQLLKWCCHTRLFFGSWKFFFFQLVVIYLQRYTEMFWGRNV